MIPEEGVLKVDKSFDIPPTAIKLAIEVSVQKKIAKKNPNNYND